MDIHEGSEEIKMLLQTIHKNTDTENRLAVATGRGVRVDKMGEGNQR